MKKINIRFEQEENKEDIDIVLKASEEDAQLLSIMDSIRASSAAVIICHDTEGASVYLPESDIISISTDHKKLKVIAGNGTYEIREPLRDVEKMLDTSLFLRISRYEIINLSKVRKFFFPISGALEIEMDNGLKTWASRRFISVIKKRLRGEE